MISRSTDNGVTFSSPPTVINDTPGEGGSFADPAVGPNGEVYVSWSRNDRILLDRSMDGGENFGNDELIATSAVGTSDLDPITAQPDRGILSGPVLDVDQSQGSYKGRLYLIYTDYANGVGDDTDVFVTWSDNDGTWSEPTTVHDNGGTSSQFHGWIDVDQVTGTVGAVWYDTRNDNDNEQVEVYISISTDGGENWQPDILLSDNPSDMSDGNANKFS